MDKTDSDGEKRLKVNNLRLNDFNEYVDTFQLFVRKSNDSTDLHLFPMERIIDAKKLRFLSNGNPYCLFFAHLSKLLTLIYLITITHPQHVISYIFII